MNKKIIALAIASAMTVPALAYAEASVSGQANMSLDLVNDGAAVSGSAYRLNSNQSRIIVKGSDDLGGGMSAMWQVDSRFYMDTGTINSTGGRLFDGNNIVGIKSDSLGTLAVGRNDTPYKNSTRKLDLFFDVAGDNRASLGGLMGRHDSRNDNALNYTSPNLGGVTIAYSTVFGGENIVANSTKGSFMSLAAMYEQGPIYVTVAIDNKKLGTPLTGDLAGAAAANVGDTDNAFKVGGSFKMDAFAVNAVVEQQTQKVIGVETKNTNVYVGGKFNLGSSDAVKVAITKRGASSPAPATPNAASQIALGYDHSMSKATSVYAAYVKSTTDAGYTVTGYAAGDDPSVISVGVKHAF